MTKDSLGGEKEPEPYLRLVCGRPRITEGGELLADPELRIAEVDKNGTCALRRMTPGQYIISRVDARYTVRRGDKTPRESATFYPLEKAVTFAVPDGEDLETTVELVLSREPLRYTLRGRVLDASGAHAVEGASVTIQGGDQRPQELKTGLDGRFEAKVGPWVYSIRVSKDGYAMQSTTQLVLDDTVLDLRLGRLLTLRGGVALPDNSTSSVAWAHIAGRGGDDTDIADTDRAGAFEFR